MRRSPSPQLRLTWDQDPGWAQLPESHRQQCRELLTQLLRQVITAELTPRSQDDEREDPGNPP
jgi:hypothetical protein